MEMFMTVIVMAIFIEAIVTYFGELRQEFHWGYVGPIVLGVFIAIVYRIDIPGLLEIKATIPYVGEVLTGIILARGSNYLYDFLNRLINIRSKGEL